MSAPIDRPTPRLGNDVVITPPSAPLPHRHLFVAGVTPAQWHATYLIKSKRRSAR